MLAPGHPKPRGRAGKAGPGHQVSPLWAVLVPTRETLRGEINSKKKKDPLCGKGQPGRHRGLARL